MQSKHSPGTEKAPFRHCGKNDFPPLPHSPAEYKGKKKKKDEEEIKEEESSWQGMAILASSILRLLFPRGKFSKLILSQISVWKGF